MIIMLECPICKHEWISKSEKISEVCPNCKSPYNYKEKFGNSEKAVIRCRICKDIWIENMGKIIKRCPNCDSISWERVNRTVSKCLRCGHEWIDKPNHKKKRCPKCNSSNWRKPLIQDRSTAYTDRCFLCGRDLIGRGTKDKYSLEEVNLVTNISVEDREQNPFGVFVCRSINKCNQAELLKELIRLTGRYDYSEIGKMRRT